MSEASLSKIESMIYVIRGHKVMLDSDLASLYGVETKALNRQVSRNEVRFPEDFMFRLTSEEYELLRCQNGTSNEGRGGRRYLPLVFTEGGVAMLSSVLTSDRAAQVNLAIIRTFTKMRAILLNDEVLSKRMKELEKGTIKVFRRVFERLDNVDEEIRTLKRETPGLPVKRKKIGIK
jgi:phage regulator Rha-like protein